MTRKPKSSLVDKASSPNALSVQQAPTEALAEAIASTSLRPTVQAAVTVMDYNKAFGELSLNRLVDDLVRQCEQASKGDLSRAEALLTAQAHTLDSIFNNLARRAQRQDYLKQFETYIRLALKAQSQCRTTLEALVLLKNPTQVAFVRQANIAHGPQQVNNGGPEAKSRAENPENQPNKLLEDRYGQGLDSQTARAAGGVDPSLETVGTVHRAENPGG